jgi:hypothetical protein
LLVLIAALTGCAQELDVVIKGVEEGVTYLGSVTPSVAANIKGAELVLSLNGQPYNGEAITLDGTHTLVATATFEDQTVSQSVSFKVVNQNYVFYQDFSKATDIEGWISPNAQENLEIVTDLVYGKHLKFIQPSTHNGSRGFYFEFPREAQVMGKQVLELDLKIKRGGNQSTQFAVLGTNVASSFENVNWGVHQNYITTFGLVASDSNYVINGTLADYAIEGGKTVSDVPEDTWLNVRILMDFDAKTSTVIIKNKDTDQVIGQETVEMATGVSALGGLYFRSGRFDAEISVGTIKVFAQ